LRVGFFEVPRERLQQRIHDFSEIAPAMLLFGCILEKLERFEKPAKEETDKLQVKL